MRNLLVVLCAVLIIIGCAKEKFDQTNPANQTAAVADRDGNNLITVCHRLGNGSYVPLQINQNALQAHLNHGDILPDADGDGHTAVGACIGSMDDCDDHNFFINPDAPEVCDNGIDDNCNGLVDADDPECAGCTYPLFDEARVDAYLTNNTENAYFDSEIDMCDPGIVDGVFYTGITNFGLLGAATFDFGELWSIIFLIDPSTGQFCALVVGVDITMEQYEATKAFLRAYRADHPDSGPSYCSIYGKVGNPKKLDLENVKKLVDAKRKMRD